MRNSGAMLGSTNALFCPQCYDIIGNGLMSCRNQNPRIPRDQRQDRTVWEPSGMTPLIEQQTTNTLKFEMSVAIFSSPPRQSKCTRKYQPPCCLISTRFSFGRNVATPPRGNLVSVCSTSCDFIPLLPTFYGVKRLFWCVRPGVLDRHSGTRIVPTWLGPTLLTPWITNAISNIGSSKSS